MKDVCSVDLEYWTSRDNLYKFSKKYIDQLLANTLDRQTSISQHFETTKIANYRTVCTEKLKTETLSSLMPNDLMFFLHVFCQSDIRLLTNHFLFDVFACESARYRGIHNEFLFLLSMATFLECFTSLADTSLSISLSLTVQEFFLNFLSKAGSRLNNLSL